MIKLQAYGLNDDVNWIKYFMNHTSADESGNCSVTEIVSDVIQDSYWPLAT